MDGSEQHEQHLPTAAQAFGAISCSCCGSRQPAIAERQRFAHQIKVMPDRRHANPEGPPQEAESSAATHAGTTSIGESSGSGNGAAPAPVPSIGAAVTLRHPLSYLKTAESRPMLRPPDLVDPGEIGQVVAHQALGQCAVRFRRGSFLIEARDLRPIQPASEPLSD